MVAIVSCQVGLDVSGEINSHGNGRGQKYSDQKLPDHRGKRGKFADSPRICATQGSMGPSAALQKQLTELDLQTRWQGVAMRTPSKISIGITNL